MVRATRQQPRLPHPGAGAAATRLSYAGRWADSLWWWSACRSASVTRRRELRVMVDVPLVAAVVTHPIGVVPVAHTPTGRAPTPRTAAHDASIRARNQATTSA